MIGALWSSQWDERVIAGDRDITENIVMFAQNIPMGRIVKADEIAQAVLFFASEHSSFMTRTALIVDGGYTAK
jgi:NAD(P)-dependent dehydrogenase (short-subunit alcohol dehydrogenase family)